MSIHENLARFAFVALMMSIIPGAPFAEENLEVWVNDALAPQGYKVLGSPSGRAGMNGPDYYGLGYKVDVKEDGNDADVQEVWLAENGIDSDGPSTVNLFDGWPQGQRLACGADGLDINYIYLTGDNHTVFLPTFGGWGGQAIGFRIKYNNEYCCSVTINARSTDIEGDGDTDEDDVAALVAGMHADPQSPQFDLNFQDGVNDVDLAIIQAEAAREVAHPDYRRAYSTSSWADPLCYTTPPLPMPTSGYHMVPPAAITSLLSHCNNLNWIAPGNDGNTGTAVSYEIRYSSSPITDANYASASVVTTGVPTPLAAGLGQTFNTTSYPAGTYFAIKTLDNVNISAVSNVVQKDCTAPAAVTNLSALADQNRIQVTWTVPGDDGNVGQAASCLVKYSTSTITSANWGSATDGCVVTPGAAGTTACCVIQNLNACTNYYFAVKTMDDNDNSSALSNVVLKKTRCNGFITLPCEDGKPQQDAGRQPDVTQLQASGPAFVHSGDAEFQLGIPAQLEGAEMRASIFDVRGRLVSSLYTGTAPSRTGTLHWNLRDTQGNQMPSGVYYLSAQVGDQRVEQRVIVVR